jgi:hypothetical protein
MTLASAFLCRRASACYGVSIVASLGYVHALFRQIGRGCDMSMKPKIALLLAFGASAIAAPLAARSSEAEVHIATKPSCLSSNESREEIKSRHFLEPFAVLKAAATQFKAGNFMRLLVVEDDRDLNRQIAPRSRTPAMRSIAPSMARRAFSRRQRTL